MKTRLDCSLKSLTTH